MTDQALSNRPVVATASPPTDAVRSQQVNIYSHSTLLYWWPAWAFGFVVGLLNLGQERFAAVWFGRAGTAPWLGRRPTCRRGSWPIRWRHSPTGIREAKLMAAICEGRVGAVVSLEASRLARDGRDWHTLLEFCGLVETLIVDEEAIYDPRSPNDRLLLGMKGTMSEMEVSVLRQRSVQAMRQKARRGELHLNVAVGYVKTDDGRIEKDADVQGISVGSMQMFEAMNRANGRRVQDGILLVFRKFAELQTIRQVLLWFREENVLVPSIVQGRGKRSIEWKTPVYHTLHHILTNPVYAGSYAYGRRGTRVTIEAGRKRVTRDALRRNWREWEV
jgi:DNA invertase Pin-like site-specific DNA recombinase